MRITRWRFFGLLLVFPWLVLHGDARALRQETSQSAQLLAAADEMVPVVARLRGLEPKAPIQKGVKSREEISEYIKQEIDAHYRKDELRREGLLLQKLGLIPPTMDYVSFAVKLLTEQVGGFYDSTKKTFFLAGWLPVDQQKPVMAHELTHALQDQYFDLEGMMNRDRAAHNDDRTLAHQALVEGDATAVMLDYLLEPAGRNFLELPDLVFIMRAQMAAMNSQFEVLKSAPDYVTETLLFPYGYGAAFLQKVRAKGQPWSVVDKIYSDPPASTEQIIHPDKYLGTRDEPKPVVVEDPTPALGGDWSVNYRNVMGEFSLFLLLKTNQSEELATHAASGWGGDQVILAEEKGGTRSAVFFDSEWDDQESADRFFAALSAWLKARCPEGRRTHASSDGFGLIANGEYNAVRRQGTRVRLIVGVPEALSEKFSSR